MWLVCVWYVFGSFVCFDMCLVCVGVCLVCVWYVCGMFWYVLICFGKCLVCVCYVVGMCLVCVWFGMCWYLVGILLYVFDMFSVCFGVCFGLRFGMCWLFFVCVRYFCCFLVCSVCCIVKCASTLSCIVDRSMLSNYKLEQSTTALQQPVLGPSHS